MRHDSKADLEKQFLQDLIRYRLPAHTREFQFSDKTGRKWRFDFFFDVPYRVGIDLHGVVVMQDEYGQATMRDARDTPQGMRAYHDKVNACTSVNLGYLVFTPQHLKSGDAIALTQRVLISRGWEPPSPKEIHREVTDISS